MRKTINLKINTVLNIKRQNLTFKQINKDTFYKSKWKLISLFVILCTLNYCDKKTLSINISHIVQHFVYKSQLILIQSHEFIRIMPQIDIFKRHKTNTLFLAPLSVRLKFVKNRFVSTLLFTMLFKIIIQIRS